MPRTPRFLLVAVLVLAGCRTVAPPTAAPGAEPVPLILVSFDGFRPDYRARAATPGLDRMAAEGVHAEHMTPVFPSLTFPNHYALVTGLYPEHHGIVGNSMYDPVLGNFSLGNRDAVTDPRWWGGEPLWATAERQGARRDDVLARLRGRHRRRPPERLGRLRRRHALRRPRRHRAGVAGPP